MKVTGYTGPGYLPGSDGEVGCLKALWAVPEPALCSGIAAPKLVCGSQGCRVGWSLCWLVRICWVLVGAVAVKVPCRRGLGLHGPHALLPPLFLSTQAPPSQSPQNRFLQGGQEASSVVGRNRLSCAPMDIQSCDGART